MYDIPDNRRLTVVVVVVTTSMSAPVTVTCVLLCGSRRPARRPASQATLGYCVTSVVVMLLNVTFEGPR